LLLMSETAGLLERMRVLVPGLLVYTALLGSLSLLTHQRFSASEFRDGRCGLRRSHSTALTIDGVERPHHSVAIGWLRTMGDGVQIVGPLVMGVLADAIDLSAPFLCGAVLLAATAWQCRRSAKALPDRVVPGGGDS